MSPWDFADKHPWWTLVYLCVLIIGLPSVVVRWRK